jgi:tetratricopeptide (TPR) repeat protein
MAAGVDAPLVHAESMQTLAVCLAQMGRSEEAIEIEEEAYRLAKEVGDFSNLMRCYTNLPSVLADQASDYAWGETGPGYGRVNARGAGARGHTAWLTGNLGDGLARFGRLEEAEALQREALELAIQVGDEPLRGMRLDSLACVVLFRGGVDEAERLHREAVPILEANPEPQSRLYVLLNEAYLALARGREDEAVRWFHATIELGRAHTVEAAPEAFTDVVRGLQRAGRADEAEAYRDLREAGRSPAARAHAALVDGLLAEDPAGARRLLAEGIAALEAIGLRIDVARAMVDLGRTMARSGDDPRAELERAREVLLGCDARLFLFEVDRAIAELDA